MYCNTDLRQLYLKTDVPHSYRSVFTHLVKRRGQKSKHALENGRNGCLGSLEKSWCSAHFPKFEARAHLSCPRTAHGTCVTPQGPAPPRPSAGPLSRRPCGFHASANTVLAPCLSSSLPAPPCHPSPGCLGLSITSRARETFQAPLKHPQDLSPGRPKTLFRK